MLFCGVHPYRNQSNKILPLSFFLFFKERALCVACLVKKAITPVLSCYLVILLSCYLVTRPHALIEKEDQVSLLVF